MKYQLFIVDFKYNNGEWDSDIMAFKDESLAMSRAEALPHIHNRQDDSFTFKIVTLEMVKK